MSLLLTPADAGYPSLLKEIHDPPERLWVDGEVSLLSSGTLIGIVGSRRCTDYGRRVAFDLAKGLAEVGVTVVSGLAFGVDAAAHEGALAGGGKAGGGKTVAVIGCGIDLCYPLENSGLQKRIRESGAVVSEFVPGTEAAPWNFPRRNRIISGLSLGIVVVEAGKKSGALITASCAVDQGREVFAVPGSIHGALSFGPHSLIQRGAKLITGVADILEEIRYQSRGAGGARENRPEIHPEKYPERYNDEGVVSGNEGKLLRLLERGPAAIDDLVQGSGLSVEETSALLVQLEIAGKIRQLMGGRYITQ